MKLSEAGLVFPSGANLKKTILKKPYLTMNIISGISLNGQGILI
jgi:hypothetical protein